MNTPERWVLIKITPPDGDTVYKVLAGWWGGYASSDYWQMNSGVVRADRFEDERGYGGWDFHGFSGSVYRCYDRFRGFTNLTHSVFERVKQDLYDSNLRRVRVELVESDTDISTLNWTNQ